MADPETAENPQVMAETAKAASQLTNVVEEYQKYKLLCSQLVEAQSLMEESLGWWTSR